MTTPELLILDIFPSASNVTLLTTDVMLFILTWNPEKSLALNALYIFDISVSMASFNVLSPFCYASMDL